MAKYKKIEKGQGLFLPVSLDAQIIPGSFEHTLNRLIDQEIDMSIFDARYKNDETGRRAIEPGILLKIILYCYSRGVISSRKIAIMCETNIIVKALAGNTEPHYSTISNFVSKMSGEIKTVFTEVLMICREMDLIDGKMFAIDGCRLPSNASKKWSGTRAELQKKYDKIRVISEKLIEKHREADENGKTFDEEYQKKLERLSKIEERIKTFLEEHKEDRVGAGGEIIKSNITDNESGKIQGPHGVIQGYNGLAIADGANQIIVAAEANGTVAEGQFFAEMLDEAAAQMAAVTGKENPLKGTTVLGDTAYFSEDNLQAAKSRGIQAIIPDQQFRQRDERLNTGKRRKGKERLDSRHFKHVADGDYYICPNEKILRCRGKVKLNRNEGTKYESRKSDCVGCPFIEKCIQSRSKKKEYRTLFIPTSKYEENLSQKMREQIDTEEYQKLYSRRIQIIEPVFADITYCKGMTRFTLRKKAKVNIQWLLYCIVHNIGKCNMAERKKQAA